MIPGLRRPLVGLDLETTGKKATTARIVSIGLRVLKPGEPGRYVDWSSLVDPGVPIPAAAAAVHGIDDAKVAGAPTFARLAPRLRPTFAACDFVGYNVGRYDLKVLAAEYARAGAPIDLSGARIVDPLRLWAALEPRTLTDAVRRWLGREPTDAHGAMGDAADAWEVAAAMLAARPDALPADLDALHALGHPRDPDWIDAEGKFAWDGDAPIVNFGKWDGTPIRDVPREYFARFMLKPGSDFAEDAKQIARDAVKGFYPVRLPGEGEEGRDGEVQGAGPRNRLF